ncbi:peptidylprolyl isomerase [Aquimarina sp. W85]|uniref:peptidylprolyl isomerase n=1 Tax=Aquimarina rhodophyticola TaxID=3342246 RepID=UPI00366DF8A2
MAVLNKIRQRSVFLIVIIALALFSFVLADLIRNGGAISQKSQNTIATINGNDIDRTEFAQKVEAASRNFGTNGSNIQAVNYVWNQEVRTVLFDEQFEELGIQVGEDEINVLVEESLANNPTFQNEAGVFDKAKLKEYVANIKATSPQAYQQWRDYEATISKGAKEEAYLNMIKAGVGVTLSEGELAYKMENDKVDIKYVQLPFTSIPDTEVTVSDSEIEAYIKKYPKRYKADASRSLQYVVFEEKPSAEDEEELKKEIATLLNDRAEFNTATNTTDTIKGFKNTENVEEFVNENSAIKYNDRFVFKNSVPQVIADDVFNGTVGDVFGPYKDGEYFKISKLVAKERMPDSTKANHILIAWKGLSTAGTIERTKEDAKKLADSILSVVQSDNDKFSALAAEYSADSSNKDKGGDLGYYTPGTMVQPFDEFSFNNPKGSKGVVETAFGYHVISIEDQSEAKDAVKLATIARKIESSEKTMNTIFTETTKFQKEAKDTDFEKAAKTKNLTVRPVNKIKELEENIPGLGAQRSVVQWAFNEERKIGDIKRFDVPAGYIVVQLTGSADKGLMSATDASTTIKPILLKDKKAEILKNKITGTSLDAIASNQGQTVKTASALNMSTPTISGAGTEPRVVGTAFALNEGTLSNPIQGNNGVYVIEVIKKTPAIKLDSYKSYANQTSKTQVNAVNSRVFNALKDAAEIEDKRATFY